MEKLTFELFSNKDYFEPFAYYTWRHNELCSCTEFQSVQDQGGLMKGILEKFHLSEDSILFKWENFNVKAKDIETSSSDYFIKLSEKTYLYIDAGRARLLYSGASSLDFKNEVCQFIASYLNKSKHEKKKFYMLVKDGNELLLQSFPVKRGTIDLHDNYNEGLFSAHTRILDFLNDENQNGLILLHGKPGTGKTSYLRYLITNIQQKIIFFPLQYMDQLSNPSFLPFISLHDRSVLVLEDCERLIEGRSLSHENGGLTNLLNLSDGLLGDALSLKVICTFNSDLRTLDPAILRKGRLVLRYEFESLTSDKASQLSEKLGHKKKYSSPTTLAEVFNPEQNSTKEEKNFGFRISKAQ